MIFFFLIFYSHLLFFFLERQIFILFTVLYFCTLRSFDFVVVDFGFSFQRLFAIRDELREDFAVALSMSHIVFRQHGGTAIEKIQNGQSVFKGQERKN